MTDKVAHYGVIIQSAIANLFDDQTDEGAQISLSEFEDSDNATSFLHALCNVVPCNLYTRLFNKQTDLLGFNHIANRLVVQNSTRLQRAELENDEDVDNG